MEKQWIFSASLLLLFLLSTISFGQEQNISNSKISADDIEKNLIAGIEKENLGLKISSAYYLGERKCTQAVIPLMNVLHTDNSEEARIVAALSLFKIGDSRGLFAIKRAVEFEDSEIVKRFCDIFYKMYLHGHSASVKINVEKKE